MKHVVIIDDSIHKRDSIREYMQKIFPDDCCIHEYRCINEGLRYIAYKHREEIKNNPNDWLIITDMVMPLYSHEMLEKDGGLHILREMKRVGFKCPVIVESSDEVDITRCREIYSNVLGTVKESIIMYNLSKYKELLKKYIS